MEKRKKFTTTLTPSTVEELKYIRETSDEKVRGLNEIIEKLVNEKWREMNDKVKR